MSDDQLPIGQRFSEAELQDAFLLVEDVPYQNEELSYRMLIPKSWSVDAVHAETAALTTTQLKPLGIFVGPDEGGLRPFIQLQAVQLTRELSAAHWLRHFAAASGRQVDLLREVSDRFADSQVTFQVEDIAFTARAAVMLDGDRAFLIFAFAPAAMYQAFIDTFGVAVSSFKLAKPSEKPSVEPRQALNVAANVQTMIPTSWKTRTIDDCPPGKAAVDLYNLDAESVLNGWIRIKQTYKDTSSSLEQVISDSKDEFAEAGVALVRVVAKTDMPSSNERFAQGIVEVYNATLASDEALLQELWIAAFEDQQAYYTVSMLTPARSDRFFIWAINHRAFEVVLQNLH